MAKYGMPYMGSKSGIAEKIIDILPKAPVLYDLFGGGGAISHCAVLSGKWRKVVYNDINKVIVDGFRTAINGGFRDEKRWISRKEFHRLKNYDPYVNLCFSFGNTGHGYAYGPDKEEHKKELHRQVISGKIKRLELDERLQHLEALERLQKLESLRHTRIQLRNVDYRTVPINEKGIIYCDIPYQDTEFYIGAGAFDHDKFYKWVAEQELPVYVSSYKIDRPDFECVAAIPKRKTLHDKENTLVHERVYRYIK